MRNRPLSGLRLRKYINFLVYRVWLDFPVLHKSCLVFRRDLRADFWGAGHLHHSHETQSASQADHSEPRSSPYTFAMVMLTVMVVVMVVMAMVILN